MNAIKEWLLAVLAASFLTAAAQAIMPKGAVKKVGQLACGLVLFLAIVSPVLSARYMELTELLESYEQELAALETETVEASKNLTASFIDQETEAYIQGKTEELGVTCGVEVTWDWSGETPVPSGAVITGTLTEDERQKLVSALSQDLAIPKEQITCAEGEAP